MINDRSAQPTGIVGRQALADFRKLSARVVEQLVIDWRLCAELLLRHPAAGIVNDSSRVRLKRATIAQVSSES